MKKIRILALMLALCMMFSLLTACKQEEIVPEAPPVTPAVTTPPEAPVVLPVEVIPTNPLTGEKLEEDASHIRPYAIMLNNLTLALPQHGVSHADIIYEVLAEGGITRMMALFQDVSQCETIGSIRSARHYYIELAQGHDAVYIHAGGSPQAYNLLNAGAIDSVDGTKGGIANNLFYRDQGRIASAGLEHSLFTTGERMVKYVDSADSIRHEHTGDYRYPQTFAEDGTPEGESASLVRAFFTPSKKTSFEFNAETKTYGVYEYGSTYIDGSTGGQVFVTNVLCLYTDVAPIPGDTYGRMNVRTTGSGTGYFACGGKITEINWERENVNVPFTYTLKNGTPLDLGVGSSYVCILPMDGNVTFE